MPKFTTSQQPPYIPRHTYIRKKTVPKPSTDDFTFHLLRQIEEINNQLYDFHTQRQIYHQQKWPTINANAAQEAPAEHLNVLEPPPNPFSHPAH